MRKLIDEHAISLGVDPKIPPIQLSDIAFDQHLARAANDRAKASEMEHAIRSHIRKHIDEDPVRFRKLSERLSEILKTLGDQWNVLSTQLQQIIDELRAGKASDDPAAADLPEHVAPFLRTVIDVLRPEQTPAGAELRRLQEGSVDLVWISPN